MNGAESLLKTLINVGVDTCFSNPGTSEMQFIAKIDECEGMRPILTLFEGVATGAADGYGRMTGKPAATLLHLGPGLANGMANLHNAKRAGTPVVNIIGDHATYHVKYDAPLTSDVVGHAKLVSDWVRVPNSASELATDAATAVEAALNNGGQIATLIVPGDYAWSDEAASPAQALSLPQPAIVNDEKIEHAIAALTSGEPCAILLGGSALLEPALEAAGRISEATGARLLGETFTARLQRGAGRVTLEHVPYFGEEAEKFLEGFRHLIILDTSAPVSFFAYPGKPSWLSPDSCSTNLLTESGDDSLGTLELLAERLDTKPTAINVQALAIPAAPPGKLTVEGIGATVAALMPEQAIVSDESATAVLGIFPMTVGAAPHDWLMLTGGAIGQGLPLAVGAATACPDRKVLALQADGSGMYTLQSLWTMAREDLDVTVVVINNGSYAILNVELERVGVTNPGPKALSMLDITNPAIDWVALSTGMGVPATRATTTEEFHEQLEAALQHKGPRLVEAMI